MNLTESYVLKTKWGYVGIAWDVLGIRQITLPDPTHEACQKRLSANRLHKVLKKLPQPIQNLCKNVELYFAGNKVTFSSKTKFNWQTLTASQIKVLSKAFDIPFGKTVSYSELASLSGFPGGARFVGNTLAKNPFPLLIPCHRIIAKNKALGGFSAPQGKEMKREMLILESCNLYG